MAVLVDTRHMSARESADAIINVLSSASVPAAVAVAPGTHSVIEGWQLSTGVNLVNTAMTNGLRMKRTARHLRVHAPERISLAVTLQGTCRIAHIDRDLLHENQLQLLDLTSGYESLWTGPNAAIGFNADYTDLGLPVDLVRAAVPLLRCSPLYDLTLRHLRDLPGIARQTPPGPALNMLGFATMDMVRALVTSTVPAGAEARDGLARSLRTVILTYIEANLHDPALTPARIAVQHGVSLRYLYKMFADEAESPAEAIIRRRLEGARRELASRATHHTLISATARRWGFTDPRHFARRFRAAYGMTPRDWVRRQLLDT
jgi:AraC-like DNA-binding protein